jgi:YD repeat-containing protein
VTDYRSLVYTYDTAGRLSQVDFDYDSSTLTKSVTYGYDLAYRRTKMVDGEGTSMVYTYDDAGRLTLLTEGGSTRGTYYHDAAGKRTKLTYGNSSYSEYLYDGAGRVTVVNNNKSDDTDIAKFAYVLDDAGLRTKMSISGSAYTSATCVYDYDSAYQLTKDTRTGGNAYTLSFWYDSAGNRTKRDLGGGAYGYQYDYIDRMTKANTTAITWDYWGNATGIATYSYSWDDSDRMTKFDHPTGTANDSTYHYLPGSRKRYKRVQDTTVEYFIHDGPNVVGSYASNGTFNALYLTPGLDDNLSMTRGGSTYYYFQDALGSVRNVVDSSEVAQNTYDHYPFGNIFAAQTENVTNPYRFTGREHEAGSLGNMHLRLQGRNVGGRPSRLGVCV